MPLSYFWKVSLAEGIIKQIGARVPSRAERRCPHLLGEVG
jgi:hypothetical protein